MQVRAQVLGNKFTEVEKPEEIACSITEQVQIAKREREHEGKVSVYTLWNHLFWQFT